MPEVLETIHERGPRSVRLSAHGMAIGVLPEMGFNLYSWQAHGRELLMDPPDIAQKGCSYGFPILFPTPNRVPDGIYSFGGRSYRQIKGGVPRLIHGLVMDEPFDITDAGVLGEDAYITGRVRFVPGTELYNAFPFACDLTVTYRLTSHGVRCDYTVANQGEGTLPFGFALHPFFSKMGAPDAIFIRQPCTQGYEAVESFPTGRILDYAGTERDLRDWTPVGAHYLDQVYYGMDSGKTAEIDYPDWGYRLTLCGSDDFKALVVYTPPHRPCFCVENQTCSSNAHNLHARGLEREAHLILLDPGYVHRGWITFDLGARP